MKEKDIKKYAKTIKKMLSTTFMPKYSVNKVIDKEKIKDYELIYDKEFYRKLEKENIGKYINNPIFMNLLSSEERIKLIITYKVMLKKMENQI